MRFQKLSIFLLLFIFALPVASAYGRKPAVEDFVGVEPQNYNRTPQGTEILFDFGNKIDATPDTTQNSYTTSTIVLISFILLPFAMWFAVTRKSQNKHEDDQSEHMAEIKNLSDYQNKEEKEDIKKAS